MSRLLAKKKAGFTLLELMIVVAILGILAAVAIPAFMTYIKRSKTAEASTNVEKMFTQASTYYGKQHVASQSVLASVFSSCTVGDILQSPATPTANKQTYTPSPNAVALGFGIADPVYYGYGGQGTATCGAAVGAGGIYTFYAIGDLDGDGDTSLFSQSVDIVAVAGSSELRKAGAIYVSDETE